MPLDPQARAVLDSIPVGDLPDLSTVPPEMMRLAFASFGADDAVVGTPNGFELTAIRRISKHPHESVSVVERQRGQDDGVDQAEHGRVDADGQGQRHDGRDRESRGLGEQTN